MIAACHQVEEDTVLFSAHTFLAHPSIHPTSATIKQYKTWTITSSTTWGEERSLPLSQAGEGWGEGGCGRPLIFIFSPMGRR